MKPTFLILLFTISLIAHSQIDTIYQLHPFKQQSRYKDFVTLNNKLLALNDSGQVAVFKLDKPKLIIIKNPPKNDKFTSLFKSKEDKLFITTSKGRVYIINSKTLKLKNILKIKYNINSLCYNSLNKLFLILYYAVYDPLYKRAWYEFPEYHSELIYKRDSSGIAVPTKKYFTIPDFSYLDKNDIWWMVKDEGEWGNELYLFDTKKSEIYTSRFRNIDLNTVTPRSIFSDIQGNTIIFNASWETWKDTLSFIKINPNGIGLKYTCVLKDEIPYDSSITVKIIDGVINVTAHPAPLGSTFSNNTATYNRGDTCVYISTSKGLYKTKWSDENTNLIPILIYKRSLQEIKMEFTNNQQLIFLTREGFLGLYQNNKCAVFK